MLAPRTHISLCTYTSFLHTRPPYTSFMQSGRDKDSLKKFITDELEVLCSVKDKAGCDTKEVKYIDTWEAKSAEDVTKQITR